MYLFSVNALNATGKALYATILVVFRMLILYAPLAYGLSGWLEHSSVFLAACVSNVGAGLLGRHFIQRYIIHVKDK
ncbi:MAG: hypothetical protein R3A45_03100 [Bdellovibrionota bacterium]